MGTIRIGHTGLVCKDYECSQDDVYLPKEQLRLWLYICVTDCCPAACDFCVYSASKTGAAKHVDPSRLREVLEQIAPFVSGVSLTGGEPMSDIPLLEDVLQAVRETISPEIEVDMVTNGLNIQRLPSLRGLERFSTVHVSRHAVDDAANASLMRWSAAPPKSVLKAAFSSLSDPGMTVLNCVLQKHGIHDLDSACAYLEMAAEIGAANVSLIGMFHANDYCTANYVSPLSLRLETDPRFTVWNQFHDHEYCQCSTGDYKSSFGYIRYYFRAPGSIPGSACCRQLVYGTDNRLRDGFGAVGRILL